jgi:DNA-directed RNA polymerase subunit RPC12/RpoP
MRRLPVLAVIGLLLCFFGFTTTGLAVSEPVTGNTETAKPLIKCSTCGVEFTSQAGLVEHLKAHPEHKGATAETAKPLIKCSTCGSEFTSVAGVEDHIKSSPGHKALIKCSTCGVEFTSGAAWEEHMKTHGM